MTRPWALMEVCGGQTHTIIRHGIDQLLPDQVKLIHGPGCPVCVTRMLAVTPDLHVLRDPTRGGLAAALNEIATASGAGVLVHEAEVPVPPAVANACSILGLDPFSVANEGKLVALVPREHAEAVLDAMRTHPLGRGATVIDEAVEAHPGMVVARTRLGGTRVVDLPIGEQLPRICSAAVGRRRGTPPRWRPTVAGLGSE